MAEITRAADTPNRYYTSKYSGEEIDALLDSIAGGAAPPTPGETPSTPSGSGSQDVWHNRNMLDNWYFPDPVNQRFTTSYSTNGFSIDRWYLVEGSMELTPGGVNLTSATIRQRTEGKMKAETALCASVLIDGGACNLSIEDGNTNTVYGSTTDAGAGRRVVTVTGTVPADRDASVWISGSMTLIAAKLEPGSAQTLAAEAGSVWTLKDAPPDKTLELLKCLRYFVKPGAFDGVLVSGWYSQGSETAKFEIPLPVPMRIKPSIVKAPILSYLGGTVRFVDGTSKTLPVSSISVKGDSDDILRVKLECDITSTAPSGPAVLDGLDVAFSAEL